MANITFLSCSRNPHRTTGQPCPTGLQDSLISYVSLLPLARIPGCLSLPLAYLSKRKQVEGVSLRNILWMSISACCKCSITYTTYWSTWQIGEAEKILKNKLGPYNSFHRVHFRNFALIFVSDPREELHQGDPVYSEHNMLRLAVVTSKQTLYNRYCLSLSHCNNVYVLHWQQIVLLEWFWVIMIVSVFSDAIE